MCENSNSRFNLSLYGDVIHEYHGYYSSIKANTSHNKGSFSVGQLADGTIILLFIYRDLFSHPILDNEFFFSGICDNGLIVESRRIDSPINPLIDEDVEGFLYAYYLKDLSIRSKSDVYCEEISFSVINCKIPYNFEITFDNLKFPDISNIRVEKNVNYENNIYLLQTLHTFKPTVRITFRLKNIIELPQVELIVNQLCLALSVCNGTKVQWIGYQLSKNKILIQEYLTEAITRPYSSFYDPINDENTSFHKVLESFLYTVDISNENLPHYLRLINNYLLTKEDGYFQEKGHHFAITLELIKEFGIIQGIIKNNGKIILDSKFRHIKKKIKQIIFDSGIDEKEISEIVKKINELNKISFNDNIRDISNYYSIPLSEDDIEFLVKSRNKLIHTGDYYLANKEDPFISSNNRFRINNVNEEYRFLLNALDKIILRLLGYKGEYYNVFTEDVDTLNIYVESN